MLSLMETKLDARKIEVVRRKISFVGCLTIDAIERKGV